MSNKVTFLMALAFLILCGCGNEGADTVSDDDDDNGIESQIIDVVSGSGTDECWVQASWTGDIEGSVNWAPEKSPISGGFIIGYKGFEIDTRRFNLTATFETPFEQGKTGTFEGKATYFYITDAPYEGPVEMGKINISFNNEYARGNLVTLVITEWQPTSISGTVSAGPFTGVAGGPLAPRDGDGPTSPLTPITVSGSAQFHAAGKITNRITGDTRCHNPYKYSHLLNSD